MKNKRITHLFLSFILILSYTACENIIDDQINSTSEVTKTSSITLTIPRYSADLVNTLNAMPDRMMILFPSITIRLYDVSDQLVQEQSYSQSSATNMGAYSATLNSIPWGSDYYLQVDVYNSSESAVTPLLSGTSLPFTVGRETADVSISLLPNIITADLPSTPGSSINGSMITTSLNTSMEFESLGGEKWYTLTPVADQIYNITISPSLNSFAYFTIYDSLGTHIDSSSGSPGTDSTYLLDAESGTTYYLGVILVDFGSQTSQNYTISLADGNISADAYEDNDTFGTAYDGSAFLENTDYYMTLHDDGTPDEDWFAIQVTEGEQYTFFMDTAISSDMSMELLDSNEWDLADNIYTAGNAQEIIWTADTDRTVYIHINNYDGEICEYQFRYTTDPPAYLSGTPLVYNTESSSVSIIDNQLDWFSFTCTAGEYIFETDSSCISRISGIYIESEGTLEDANDVYMDSSTCGLIASEDGTYYIAVESYPYPSPGSFTVTARAPIAGTASVELTDCGNLNGKTIYLGLWNQLAEIGVDAPVALWSGMVESGQVAPSPFIDFLDDSQDWTGSGLYSLFGYVDMDNSVSQSGDPLEGPTTGDYILGYFFDSEFHGITKLVDDGLVIGLSQNYFVYIYSE